MLDLRRLRLLREFANRGTIAATAAALGYSTSAVSQQLSTLEREAGGALLDRTARSASLTDLGRELAAHAERILAAVEAAEADLAARTGTPSGRVAVSAFPTSAVAFAPALATGLRRYPDVTLVVRQGKPRHNLAEVLAGDADIAVVDDWSDEFRPGQSGAIMVHRLCRDPLVLAVGRRHQLAGETAPVDLGELAGERWIAAPVPEPSRLAADRLLAEAGVAAVTRWEFEGLDTVLALVAQGAGIAVVPRLALVGRGAHLAARTLPVATAAREIYAITRAASARRPAIALVLRVLRDAASTAAAAATSPSGSHS